jgi:predicted SAM-dependent methyltransferase
MVTSFGLTFVARAARQVVWELRIWWADRGGRRKARALPAQNLKLQVGCGPKLKQGWVNIDLVDGADIALDLRRPLPFADASCDIVYAEHFFEHLDYPDDADAFLRECRRVLRPGGRLSLGVPDAVPAMKACVADIEQGRTEVPRQSYQPAWCRTPMDQTNFLFRQNYLYWLHEHKYAYDYATLALHVTAAGFAQVRRRDFDASLDSPEHAGGTIYVEAIR